MSAIPAAASNPTPPPVSDLLDDDIVFVNEDGASEPRTPIRDTEHEEEPPRAPSAPISDAVAAKNELAPDTQAALRQRISPPPPAEPDKPKLADIVVRQKSGCCDCFKRLWSKC